MIYFNAKISVKLSIVLYVTFVRYLCRLKSQNSNNMWNFPVCTDEISSLLKSYNSDSTNNIRSRK